MGNYLANREFDRMTLRIRDLAEYQGSKRLSKKLRDAIIHYIVVDTSLTRTAAKFEMHWTTLSEAVKEVKADRMRREFEERHAKWLAESKARQDADLLKLFE